MRLSMLMRALSTIVLIVAFHGMGFAQGVTTSSMQGKIQDVNGETLIGANILAVHQPSGTTYGTATDVEGNYRIPNMRVGGPYKIAVTYTGFTEKVFEGIFLRLGETQRLDITLEESAVELETIQDGMSTEVSKIVVWVWSPLTTGEELLPTMQPEKLSTVFPNSPHTPIRKSRLRPINAKLPMPT